MAATDYTIGELKGIAGYQFLQVMYFLLRSAYYSPETNNQFKRIEDFFTYVAKLEGEERESFLNKVSTLCGDLDDNYWHIIMKNVLFAGKPVIPESIQTIPAGVLVYIVKEGLKKVLAINLPF